MSVLIETKNNGLPIKRLYIKGASEIIVNCISYIHTYDDKKIKLSN